MGGIRKASHVHRRPNFRKRLQRALSLSSSESTDAGSPSNPARGDTTDDDSSYQDEQDSGDQDNSTSADESDQEAGQPWRSVPRHKKESKIRGQTQISADSNAVALECLTELDKRMESIERSSYDQVNWNDTIRNDLSDILGRLAIVETEIQTVTRRNSSKATEGQNSRRSARSQQ